MLLGKDVSKCTISVLFKTFLKLYYTWLRDIHTLVEESPLSLLQGELESTIMEYPIYSPNIYIAAANLSRRKNVVFRGYEATKKLRRRSFVVMLRRRYVEMLHPYDVAEDESTTKLLRLSDESAMSLFRRSATWYGCNITTYLWRNCDESTTSWRRRRFVVCLLGKLLKCFFEVRILGL